jgi:hypothetical protein
MSKTMRSSARRLPCAFVQMILVVAGFAPGWVTGDVLARQSAAKAPAAVNDPPGTATDIALRPEEAANVPGVVRNDPGAPNARRKFLTEITCLDGFLTKLNEGEKAAPGSPEREIADCLATNLSWVTLALISAHDSGMKNDGPLKASLLNDLELMCSTTDLATMRFAKQHFPANLLSRPLDRPEELVLRNQLLLAKEYPDLRLEEPGGHPGPEFLEHRDDRFGEFPNRPSPGYPGPQLGEPPLPHCEMERRIARITKALDRIDRAIEEWGRASVSGFALIDNISVNGRGFFNLNYNQPTEFYVAQVRQNVQGALATLVQKTFTGQLQAQLTQNQISLAPSPPKSTNSPAASTNSPAPGLTNSPAPSATNAGPSGYLGLLSQAGASPQLSENDVLKGGATDKETERVLNFMSDPTSLPSNQRAYLAVMQVSISPGWRTKQGYVGEVQLSFRYGAAVEAMKQRLKELTEKLGHPPKTENNIEITAEMLEGGMLQDDSVIKALGIPSTFPGVLSVFPFADAQALDFRSSLQKQLNMLLQISASLQTVSPKLQAQLLASYQKLARQDSASRNLLPLVVPSSRGGDVTFRFDPEFQALAQPGNPESKPGQVLEPSSFPALIVLVCEEEEILRNDTILATTETRWLPAKRRSWWKQYFYDPYAYPWARPGSSLKNKERFTVAENLDSVHEDLQSITDPHDHGLAVYQEASRRWNNLRTFAMGRTVVATLPTVTPVVTAVYPPSFRRDSMPTNITVFCRYVLGDCATNDHRFRLKKVALGGLVMTNCLVTDRHWVNVPLPREAKDLLQPGSYDLAVVNSEGPTILSNAVTVCPVPAPVITSVFPTNIEGVVTGSVAEATGESSGTASAGSPADRKHRIEKLLIDPDTTLTIAGSNLYVNDDSLKVAVGGVALADAASATGPAPPVRMIRHDNLLTLTLNPSSLSELKPGKYNVAVVTSGGQMVLSNALAITPRKVIPGPNELVVASVHPEHGNLYSTTTISIVGSNFFGMRGGARYKAKGGSATPGPGEGRVTVGGVDCAFDYLSSSNLVAFVPPRAAAYSTNEAAMATNKLEVVVSGPHGVGTLSNAIAFDLLLPKDGGLDLEKHTVAEKQSQKTLDAVVLAARARDTDAVLDTERLLTSAMILSHSLGTNGAADSVTRTTARVGPKEGAWDEYELPKVLGVLINILSGTNAPPVVHRTPAP